MSTSKSGRLLPLPADFDCVAWSTRPADRDPPASMEIEDKNAANIIIEQHNKTSIMATTMRYRPREFYWYRDYGCGVSARASLGLLRAGKAASFPRGGAGSGSGSSAYLAHDHEDVAELRVAAALEREKDAPKRPLLTRPSLCSLCSVPWPSAAPTRSLLSSSSLSSSLPSSSCLFATSSISLSISGPPKAFAWPLGTSPHAIIKEFTRAEQSASYTLSESVQVVDVIKSAKLPDSTRSMEIEADFRVKMNSYESQVNDHSDYRGNISVILYPVLGITFLHHVSLVFNWSMQCLALLDLILVQLEIGALSYLLGYLTENWLKAYESIPLGLIGPPSAPQWLAQVVFIAVIGLLAVSTIFRVGTMIRTPTKFYRQPFVFLGGCRKAIPEYTPMRVLLNRSLARPLVKELVQVPRMGDAVFVGPALTVLLERVMVNPIQCPYPCKVDWSTATISTYGYNIDNDGFLQTWPCAISNIQLPWAGDYRDTAVICSDRDINSNLPMGLEDDLSPITVSLQVPLGVAVRMYPLQAAFTNTPEATNDFVNSAYAADGWVPIMAGSSLFAELTWTERRVLTTKLAGITGISGLQPYPQGAVAGGNLTSLTLRLAYWPPAHVLQEVQDTDPISGFSTLGGLWTSVDGIFAMFFGANVVYFLFGRRPLSALGIAHIFQRGALTGQWHKGFPKLRTEGGQPGSEDAGIVAFIRQRLIDIDENSKPHDDEISRPPSEMEMTPREGMVGNDSEDNLTERLLSSGAPHNLGRACTV
ncbi:hypothetical protein FB45DRAFT_867904 [Roridomyces roridus]|uniref:Uncharacterized protein n=1 Tax=Roridomyces roridus TaxID=1738132 RepID=A0AAD7BRW8_9AGAR|nr:hypothetical protein FB45DRAFT_867904 [Roridomyces roridus]